MYVSVYVYCLASSELYHFATLAMPSSSEILASKSRSNLALVTSANVPPTSPGRFGSFSITTASSEVEDLSSSDAAF